MGGADAVMGEAGASFEAGEYRWTAQVLNHVMFAAADHQEARDLLAKTYDQLGYRAESGPWREVYLTGAFELRHGARGSALDMKKALGLLKHVPIERFLASMATPLKGPEAAGENLSVNFHFTDRDENYRLWIGNAVLHYKREPLGRRAAEVMHMRHDFLLALITGQGAQGNDLFGCAECGRQSRQTAAVFLPAGQAKG